MDTAVPLDMIPDELRGDEVPADMIPAELSVGDEVPADMLPAEFAEEQPLPEPLGPPLPESGGRRFGRPSRVSTPLFARNAFIPFGAQITEPPRKPPGEYETTVGGSLAQSLSEDFQLPTGADFMEGIRGMTARWLQGFKLKQLEDLEDEMLGRWYDWRGEPHYRRTPAELRELDSNPLLAEVRSQIKDAQDTGVEISAMQAEIGERNQNYWQKVVNMSGQSLTASVPSVVVAAASGSPFIGTSLMFPTTKYGAYGELREQGASRPGAALGSNIEAAIEVGTELPGMMAATRAGSPALRRLGETGAANLPGETVATLGQSVNRAAVLAPEDVSAMDILAEGLEQGRSDLPVTWGSVLLTSAGQGAAGHAMDLMRRKQQMGAREQVAEATKDYALAKGQDLLNMIRNPPTRAQTGAVPEPMTLTQPTPEDLERMYAAMGHIDPNRTFPPEGPPGTMPPPDTTGSPAPEAGAGSRIAPFPATPQGTASPPPLSSAFQQPAAAPAPSAPQEPAPAPAPQAAPAVSTAQKPLAGAAATPRKRAKPPSPQLPLFGEETPEPAQAEPAKHPAAGTTFETSKGSTYAVDDQGLTTRNKKARPEHPGDEGQQEKSQATYYVTDEDANKLSEFQATSPERSGKRIVPLGDGRIGVKYTAGKNKGKFSRDSVVTPETEPRVGLTPVETWNDGAIVHFGNPITKVTKPAPAAQVEAKPTAPTVTPATAGQPVDEATRDFNKTPRGGWPAAGHWIYQFADGHLTDGDVATELSRIQSRMDNNGTPKDRAKMDKAVAGIRKDYQRFAKLEKEVMSKKLDTPHPALAYRLQEMLTETNPKTLAEEADGLRHMLAQSIESAEFKIKEAKRVARNTPKPKPEAPAQVEPKPEEPTARSEPAAPLPKKLQPKETYPQASEGMEVREIVPGGEVEGEHGAVVDIPTTKDKFQEVINEVPALFEDPQERVVAIYSPKHYKGPWLSKSEAAKRIESWKQHAQDQGETRQNNGRVILSLFDLTGNWAQPYADAGYDVRVFDLQNGADVNDFSAEWFAENLPEVSDVYGILIACPCTDFTVSGSQWWKQKDADGRTEASKELVFQALRTVEFWRPHFWVLENPVGRIEQLAGLPPARLTFNPNAFGEPYTKITQLWGKFNADLPVAPVKPTEGSKMHSKYGGGSLRTKNARSETPEGFAAAFFMANNYADTPAVTRLTNEFPEAAGAIEKALDAGFSEEQIREVVTDPYENYESQEARAAVRQLVKTGEPAGTAPVVGQDEDVGTTAAEKPRKIKIKKPGVKGRKAATRGVEGMMEPTAQEREESIAAQELREAIEEETRAAQEPEAAPTEAMAQETEASSRTHRGEKLTLPSTPRESVPEDLNIDPTEFRLMGGKDQWLTVVQAIKDKYGFAHIAKHPNQTWRNAVDHLLDGYDSLQNLANAMGQGNKIASLGGKVSLYMREKPNKYGGYFRWRGGLSGERDNTIAIFNQEDVYSHELGHALDYDLMERVGGMESGGLTRMIRTREQTAMLPNNLQEAFVDVMTAMYYDGAEIAALIKKAEHQLEKAGTDKQRAHFQKRLDNLRSGAWRGRTGKTQFYQRAKDGPLAKYLTTPTELFARAFEAYISWKIQSQQELGLVKFLGKPDAIYRKEADAWLARIYPQASDRAQIFAAFDNLLGQLARENLYNTGNNPGWSRGRLNIGLIDPVAQAKAEGMAVTQEVVQAHNLTQKAAETFVEDQLARNDTLMNNMGAVAADVKRGLPGSSDKFHAGVKTLTSTPDGVFKFLEIRFPHITILREMRNQLSDAAIAGRKKPVGVYREIQRQENSITNRLEDRLKAVGITRNMPKAWSSRMWDILHGKARPANELEKRQADQLRYELEYLWKLRDQTGEEIGYVDYEYMPRAFMRNIADDKGFHNKLLELRIAEKKALIEKLNEKLSKAKTEEETAAIEKKIKEAEKIDPVKQQRAQVAAMKALKWGEPIYLGAASEDSAKERVFGPLADEILKDYYVQDPFTLIAGYGASAARGMVMRRRFGGKQNAVFQGWLDELALELPSAYSDILLRAMQASLGVRRDGASTLARGINAYTNVAVASMLGRSVLPNLSEPLNILSKSITPATTLGQLVRAALPASFKSQSLKEAHAAADRFGRLSGTLVDAASSMTAMAQAVGEDTQGMGLLARFSMRAYWFNLLSSLTAAQEKATNRVAFEAFYEAARIVREGGKDANIMRVWLTEHGIKDPVAFSDFLKGHAQLDDIAFEDMVTPGSVGMTLANALDHFVHTTIQKPTPSTKHILSHVPYIGVAFRLTSWMTTNFINWAVLIKDRTEMALAGKYGGEQISLESRFKGEHLGQKLSALERFSGRVGGEKMTAGQRLGAMMYPAAMALGTMYVAQAAFLVARMMLTHPEEWEERGDDFWERFGNSKTQWQVVQYWGVAGYLMNVIIDAVEQTRFNRGIYGAIAGPSYGGIAQDTERLIALGVDTYEVASGEKLPSNAVRNNAAQAAYHQASMLATVGILSVLPTANRFSRAVGGLWSFFGTSPYFQHEFADLVAGEKTASLRTKAAKGDIAAKMELMKRKFDNSVDKRKLELDQKLEKAKGQKP